MFTVLVCDDDRDIVKGIRILLESEGYSVVTAADGREAVELVKAGVKADLVLMDVMMPEMNGLEAVAQIREITNIPAVMLSARSENTDKVAGLNVGADDYVTKPYDSNELLARINAQLRRYQSLGGAVQPEPGNLVNGGLEIDENTKTVKVEGKSVSLTPKEFDILHFFMENLGKVFSPREIYTRVWENDPYGAENTVTVHIRHLREKIEIDPANPRYIIVAWGHGYKMEDLR